MVGVGARRDAVDGVDGEVEVHQPRRHVGGAAARRVVERGRQRVGASIASPENSRVEPRAWMVSPSARPAVSSGGGSDTSAAGRRGGGRRAARRRARSAPVEHLGLGVEARVGVRVDEERIAHLATADSGTTAGAIACDGG